MEPRLRAVPRAVLGLCAELQHPCFAAATELTAPCAPPGPSSLQTACQGQAEARDSCWVSPCCCWGSSKTQEGFCWGNGRAGLGQ